MVGRTRAGHPYIHNQCCDHTVQKDVTIVKDLGQMNSPDVNIEGASFLQIVVHRLAESSQCIDRQHRPVFSFLSRKGECVSVSRCALER